MFLNIRGHKLVLWYQPYFLAFQFDYLSGNSAEFLNKPERYVDEPIKYKGYHENPFDKMKETQLHLMFLVSLKNRNVGKLAETGFEINRKSY